MRRQVRRLEQSPGTKEVGAARFRTTPTTGIPKFCFCGSPGVRMGYQSNFSNNNKPILIFDQSAEQGYIMEYSAI